MTRAIGGHHSPMAKTTTWLTPPALISALGGPDAFDLDPCAAPLPRPWPTARVMNSEADRDGLSISWFGRVWLNPPYTSSEIAAWLDKLASHGRGTGLIFARTETEAFHRHVWQRAHGCLFLHGRLHFHSAIGVRAKANAGAPSVLVAYGADDLDRLAESGLAGALVPLKLARSIVVEIADPSWRSLVADWLAAQSGPVSVDQAYRVFSGHRKDSRNQHWRAKVRQKLQQVGRRVGRAEYEIKEAGNG